MSNARFLTTYLLTVVLGMAAPATAQEASTDILTTLRAEADSLRPLVRSTIGHQFLDAVSALTGPGETRTIYYNRSTRDAVDSTAWAALADSVQADYARVDADERFYFTTRYGTPLAFVRALDLVGEGGMSSLDGAAVCDFGFGSIGQLQLMALLGATAVGVEVDPLLEVLYAGDNGPVPRAEIAGPGEAGEVKALFGSFPSDRDLVREVGPTLDLFVSKNTLKRGYIHPAREVDPRMTIDLGVSDSVFVSTVADLVRPGGWFMIYNLSPPEAGEDEPYIPWADGRCPFDSTLLEQVGFTVVAFNQDDTPFARRMGAALGWGMQMNLETDLYGTYTLLRRR